MSIDVCQRCEGAGCALCEPEKYRVKVFTMKVRARVYLKEGNRLIIPGHWYSDDDPNLGMGSASTVIIESMMWNTVCGFEPCDEWVEIEADSAGQGSIEHFRCDLVGQQFAHGGVTVWVISGPLFDAAKAKEPKPNG